MFIPTKLTSKGIINGIIFTFQNGDDKEINAYANVLFGKKPIAIRTTISVENWLIACEEFVFSEHYKRYNKN